MVFIFIYIIGRTQLTTSSDRCMQSPL